LKRRLLDLLACPSCLSFPLELIVEDERKENGLSTIPERPLCEIWCAFIGSRPEDPSNCVKCMELEVISGKLSCKNCGAEYKIEEGVPRMLRPDETRL
jgi:uncharacterized protein YbaR (Trm112 family)